MGQNTGKAIVEYQSEKNATEAVSVFDNRAVDDMINFAKPVFHKGDHSPRLDANLLARRVYLMNVPYDAHVTEIYRLVSDFAEVDKVVVPRDPKGLARGYCFVYLKKS